MISNPEVIFDSGALFALRGHCVLKRDKACRPFCASGILPSLRSGEVLLTKPNASCGEFPASVRDCGNR